MWAHLDGLRSLIDSFTDIDCLGLQIHISGLIIKVQFIRHILKYPATENLQFKIILQYVMKLFPRFQ